MCSITCSVYGGGEGGLLHIDVYACDVRVAVGQAERLFCPCLNDRFFIPFLHLSQVEDHAETVPCWSNFNIVTSRMCRIFL
jgi:hypothetical protein